MPFVQKSHINIVKLRLQCKKFFLFVLFFFLFYLSILNYAHAGRKQESTLPQVLCLCICRYFTERFPVYATICFHSKKTFQRFIMYFPLTTFMTTFLHQCSSTNHTSSISGSIYLLYLGYHCMHTFLKKNRKYYQSYV